MKKYYVIELPDRIERHNIKYILSSPEIMDFHENKTKFNEAWYNRSGTGLVLFNGERILMPEYWIVEKEETS